MADQYRKLQPYYNSKSVLVAAGDDFLFAGEKDLPTVHKVYSALFKYINEHPKFNMKVRVFSICYFIIFIYFVLLRLSSNHHSFDSFPFTEVNPSKISY